MTSMHAASVTEPATTPPSETVLRAREVFSEGLAEVQQFAADTMALSPEELAVRAGLTLAVIVGAALALWLLRFIFKSIAKRLAPPEDAAPRKRVKIGGWTMLIARLAIWVLAFLLVLQIWGVDLARVMEGPFGAMLGALGRAALTIIVMLAAIDLARMAIHRLFGRMSDRARTPRRAAQIRTVAPVVGGIVTSVLVVIATMMVLSNVGIEIGPLLAGAGIVGLAVGFGAQTLVKDFLTGFFLIIEDVVSVGDVAKIGDASGVVEDMSMRTIKLRAFDGTLQVIPYGEAQIIYNMTKGFSFYVFDLSISYSSDIVRALEVMKQVGDEMQKDEAFAPLILEPIEIFGVDSLADSGVMLKARFKTQPIKQWTVGREYLKRVKLAFDANGIEIPFPHLKLVPPDAPIPVDETRPRAAE